MGFHYIVDIDNLADAHEVDQKDCKKDGGVESCESEYLGWGGVVVIIEVEGQPMTNFVLLEAVEVETQHPDVEDINSHSPICGKIPGKNRVVLNAESHVNNDEYKNAKNDKTGSNTNSHKEKLSLRTFIFVSGVSKIFSSIFTLHLFVLFYV